MRTKHASDPTQVPTTPQKVTARVPVESTYAAQAKSIFTSLRLSAKNPVVYRPKSAQLTPVVADKANKDHNAQKGWSE
ncbi:hypothetical protein LTR47_005773 [Exophiala xenobiotica]|nr:hypothetical protein LTR47_005773 [Exophiala xenobiotica]KAK5241327.1 hypothetical protein LTS06_012137 [Exophiala xenobiotica]KAK5280237.1 hypothetical protein LTR40_006646 [Exophiala xenobiotica]